MTKAAEVDLSRPPAKKELIGVDVFIHWTERDPNKLGNALQTLNNEDIALSMISNRGQKVYPDGLPETFCVDHWRCRFMAPTKGQVITHEQIVGLLGRVAAAGYDFIKTEHLYLFDGVEGFTRGQGE